MQIFFGLKKVGNMAVDMEYHVTFRITDGQARMGGGAVEDPKDLIIGILGGLGLLGGDRDEVGKHGRVECYCIVQQGPDDLLEEGDGLGWQDRRFVGVIGPLDCRSICRGLTGMGGILRACWRRMLELVEGLREVVKHEDVAGLPGVVPG